MKKTLILAFLFTQSFNANAEFSLITDISGGKMATVAWDPKSCLDPVWPLYGCPTQQENSFYAPTVLIFDKNGNISKSIAFYDEDCPYHPIALSRHGQKLTLTVLLGGYFTLSFDGNPYPDCKIADGTMLREIRDLRNGKLIKQMTVQNYRTATIP